MTTPPKPMPDEIYLGNKKQELRHISVNGTDAEKYFGPDTKYVRADAAPTPIEWECFCDASYYDLWAVRPIGDKSFHSQQLFHVQSMEEATALRDTLNQSLTGRK